MIEVQTESDLELLREAVDLECKLAKGRDGKGAVPDDFWSTYSAFANTNGGVVLLGVRENQGRFSIEGIQDVAKVRSDLFNLLNNRQKISVNLLADESVREVVLSGATILVIEVPRANRRDRPVYITTNPLGGHAYWRLNDGDRAMADEDVKRMLAEQVDESRDDRILRGYDVDDLDGGTLRAYRQVFASRDPNHPWNELADREFLRQIGAWRVDRESNVAGITVAGLLMFGRMASIQDEFPNYMLDYQERPEPKAELRWIDRLTLDGKWSGNLYDFYRRVYLKITADLKVPFVLEKGERRDETPVHEALREALANTLVHADYSDRASVVVVKRPDMFGFRNPGLMRIPATVAIQGGESDCRNRTLHKMFRFVGVGEQAGSGVPKIYRGWATQHWRAPSIYERIEPYSQTLLELRMIDLLPASVVEQLRTQFGERFDALGREQRLALVTAATERVVTHARIREMTAQHGFDVTRMLQDLVANRFLEQHNPGRGAVYCLPGSGLPTPEEVFGASSAVYGLRSAHSSDRSAHLSNRSAHSSELSAHLSVGSAHDKADPTADESSRDSDGRLVSSQLDAPVIDSLDLLSDGLRTRLETLAAAPRAKKSLRKEIMQEVILAVCRDHFMTLSCLSKLVNRDPDALRQQYLKPLTKDGKLTLAFPTTPTNARQAYRTSE